MGLISKSIIILIIATSAPIIYRHFATDNTVKFMSQYYSNYRVLDQFLKQTAVQLDTAKEYLPSVQIKETFDKINRQLKDTLSTISKSTTSDEPRKTEKSTEKKSQEKPLTDTRFVSCPKENLKGEKIRLWSKQELAKYDGKSGEAEIFLACLGSVYNVTANMQHYVDGADYNAFAGRDATRAFVTGNFTHDLHDDIRDIDESLYSHIESWTSFYNSNYPDVGRLEGQFFDSKGCQTQELTRVHQAFDRVRQKESDAKQQELNFPECNSEWNGDLKKGRVWCTTKSGGVDREWVGVPRIYSNGESQRCVCFNKDGPEAGEAVKFMSNYPACETDATECPLSQG